jgi:hypothetical protein
MRPFGIGGADRDLMIVPSPLETGTDCATMQERGAERSALLPTANLSELR